MAVRGPGAPPEEEDSSPGGGFCWPAGGCSGEPDQSARGRTPSAIEKETQESMLRLVCKKTDTNSAYNTGEDTFSEARMITWMLTSARRLFFPGNPLRYMGRCSSASGRPSDPRTTFTADVSRKGAVFITTTSKEINFNKEIISK